MEHNFKLTIYLMNKCPIYFQFIQSQYQLLVQISRSYEAMKRLL